MSFDWNDYFGLATRLHQDAAQLGTSPSSPEACHRASISRAYYAAFKLSSQFAQRYKQKVGIAVPALRLNHSARDHQELTNWLTSASHQDLLLMSRKLQTIRKNRNKADYKNHIGSASALASTTLREVRDILDIINRIAP